MISRWGESLSISSAGDKKVLLGSIKKPAIAGFEIRR